MTKRISFGCLVGVLLAAGGCDEAVPTMTDGTGGSAVVVVGTGGRTSGGTGGSVDAGRSCPTAPYSHVTTFGSIFDGWGVALNSAPTLVPMPGAGPDGGFSGSVLELDSTDGSPANGSAKLTIPFAEVNQELIFAQNFSPGVNMAGATLTAQIKLDSGLITGPTDLGIAFLVVKSTVGYVYAPSASTTLDPMSGWTTLTLNVDAPSPDVPSGHNPCDVREVDLVIRTGQSGNYRTAVVHIDTISITRPGDRDGGS